MLEIAKELKILQKQHDVDIKDMEAKIADYDAKLRALQDEIEEANNEQFQTMSGGRFTDGIRNCLFLFQKASAETQCQQCQYRVWSGVNSDRSSFLLDVYVPADGNAGDYMDHIKHIYEKEKNVHAYCDAVRPGDFDVVLADIKIMITSIISDQPVVNHSVIKDPEEYLGNRVIELNCNVHPQRQPLECFW